MSHETPPRPGAKGWLDQYVEAYDLDPDFVAEGMAIRLMEEAVRLMADEDISRSALAEMMGVSKPYITRLFSAPPNLTLRSIAQLAIALGTKPHVSLLPACPPSERAFHLAASNVGGGTTTFSSEGVDCSSSRLPRPSATTAV